MEYNNHATNAPRELNAGELDRVLGGNGNFAATLAAAVINAVSPTAKCTRLTGRLFARIDGLQATGDRHPSIKRRGGARKIICLVPWGTARP